MNAKEQGIDIIYEIHTIKWNNKIEINELELTETIYLIAKNQ